MKKVLGYLRQAEVRLLKIESGSGGSGSGNVSGVNSMRSTPQGKDGGLGRILSR
jgi:hypothetical protein